jgi:hypothetical protein
MFYLVPGLLIALAAGGELVRRVSAQLSPALGVPVMGAILVPPILAFAQDPPPTSWSTHPLCSRTCRRNGSPAISCTSFRSRASP